MEIEKNTGTANPRTSNTTGKSELGQLKEGSVVTARVMNSSNNTAQQPQLTLQINNRTFEIPSNLEALRGDILKLKVERSEAGTQLKLIEKIRPGNSQAEGVRQTGDQQLRQFIPIQRSLNTMAAQLQSTLADPSLPTNIKTLITNILSQLPRANQLVTPQAVSTAIRNSGLFFEAIQASGQLPTQGDLKFGLLSLITQLRAALPPNARAIYPDPASAGQQAMSFSPMNPLVTARQGHISRSAEKSLDLLLLKLLGIAESATARTSLSQLATAESQVQGDQRWKFEIPIFLQNQEIAIADIVIQQEDEHKEDSDEEKQKQWQLQMAIDLPELGALQASVRLREKQIGLMLTVSQPETAKLFNVHMERLKTQLTDNGFEITRLDCVEGDIKLPETGQLYTKILSVKA
jgi:hypothetical protein